MQNSSEVTVDLEVEVQAYVSEEFVETNLVNIP